MQNPEISSETTTRVSKKTIKMTTFTSKNSEQSLTLESAANGDMKKLRQSIAIRPEEMNKQRQTVANTLARASMRFELKNGSDAVEVLIENERLKTKIMIL